MRSRHISIWLFIGVLLTIYGVLIASYGIVEMTTKQTANVVLGHLHGPLWWGGIMLALGLFYVVQV